jgi:hypothetical protein
MFGFAETKRQMQDLLLETRSYVGLQKKALLIETRDKLGTLLSRLAIAVVCLILGSLALLFFFFFLAYIVGQALGNVALGFAAVTLLVLLLLLLFWHMRTKWVILPITDMMTNLFTVDDQPLETEKVSEELRESRARMNDNFQQMMHTGERPANRVDAVTSWVSRGVAAYEGLRIGLSVIRAIGTIFGRKRRRR